MPPDEQILAWLSGPIHGTRPVGKSNRVQTQLPSAAEGIRQGEYAVHDRFGKARRRGPCRAEADGSGPGRRAERIRGGTRQKSLLNTPSAYSISNSL